jgi:uncharacterized repeat protein (TIGR02543 family)
MEEYMKRAILAVFAVLAVLAACDNSTGGGGEEQPALTGSVSISGTAQVGRPLTAMVSNSNGTGTATYQWMHGASVTVGENLNTYIPVEADIGSTIRVKVSYAGFSGELVSLPTATVAVPEDPEYTVTFASNGGTAVAAQTVAQVDYVSEPPEPTKDGYAFGGWYKEAALTNPWDLGTDTVSADITLYAKWKIVYTVTFESNGGSAVAAQAVGSGDKVTQPSAPTKAGNVFINWYKEEALTNSWNFYSDTVSADITLYAKWWIQEYGVSNTGPGGGKIFYVSSEGFGPDNAWHYLEAAPSDISGKMNFGSLGTWTTAQATAIGTGSANTSQILSANQNASAAKACADYTNNGKSDWFLPSKSELNQLYTNRTWVGSFKSDFYWSSSVHGNGTAWVQSFSSGNQDYRIAYASNVLYYVRPIRAF